MILNWRNNPNIKKWMYNNNDISKEEHYYFIDNLKSDTTKLYFLLKKENVNIGVIDFYELDKEDIYYGFYGNPEATIMGIGRILEEVCLDYAFNKLKVKKLKLEVFEENIYVRNLHKKYKFKESGEKYINNKKVICMELENENR